MGAGYDIVLVAHVLVAALALGSTVATVLLARLASRPRTAELPAVARYFSPGTNWVERVLFVVPVPGYALVSMSGSRISFGEAWLVIGTLLWASALAVALVLAWPAERALQRRMNLPREEAAEPAGTADNPGRWPDREALARRLVATSAVVAVLLFVAFVVMVTQPGGQG